jgi:hypothetical protein
MQVSDIRWNKLLEQMPMVFPISNAVQRGAIGMLDTVYSKEGEKEYTELAQSSVTELVVEINIR